MALTNRLSLEDNAQSICVKMCDGNPGALSVIIKLVQQEATIDPDSGLAPYGTILSLDDLGIYGSAIWVLFKDVCGESIPNLVALFRAHQLGFIGGEIIVRASSERGVEIDMADLLKKVKGALPAFAA